MCSRSHHETRSSALYADIYVRHEEIDETKIFGDLPFHLRAEVAANLTKNLLKSSHVSMFAVPMQEYAALQAEKVNMLLVGH